MKVTSERLENCEVLLTIEVEAEQVEQAVHKAAQKISQQTNIPGFRRGKAPFHIVLQRFGRQTLLEEALEDLGQEAYSQALDEAKIEPFAQGQLDDVQFDPMVLKMRVPVAPVVELGAYRDLRLDVPTVSVTDEEVEKALTGLQDRNAAWVPVERRAEWGDRATVAFAFAGEEAGEARDILLDSESRYPVPGFNEKLIGATADSELDFDLTYPEDWPVENMAGQVKSFHVQVQEVKCKDLPGLEDLPALVGDYDDLDALKASLRDDLQKSMQAKSDGELLDKALEQLVAQSKIEYPVALLEDELESILDRHDSTLKQQGLDLETYLKVLKTTREEYKEKQREEAVRRVCNTLVLSKLAELEGLKVDPEELTTEITGRTEAAGEQAEAMREMLTSRAGVSYLLNQLITRKSFDRLLLIVKGEAPAVEVLPAEAGEATAAE